jgi:hypothetical protein
MDYLKTVVRTAAVALFCGVLYVGLNWVPIAGPLIVGFTAGWLRRGTPKECFKMGVYSAMIGFIAISALFSWWRMSTPSNEPVFSLLAAWIILLWNVLGIILAGLGGAAAGLFGVFNRLVGLDTGAEKSKTTVSYAICENCGCGYSGESCTLCGSGKWVS